MTAFYVLGGVVAAWALIVTALGVSRNDFPRGRAAERGVAAISVILVAGAIGSAIVSAANEEEEPEGEAAAQEAGQEAPARNPLQLTADPGGGLRFDETELSARAGEVTIDMENPSSVPHNIAIEGRGVDEQGQTVAQGTSTVSAELPPGEYTFYCSVPGHRQGGMEGTLTVK